MFDPESLKDLPVIVILGAIMLAGIGLFAKSLLPSIVFLAKAQAEAVQAQAEIAKNTEDSYEKNLAINAELLKQQFISRDRERDLQLARLRDEIQGLVQKVELGLSEIDTLKKRGAILDESNAEKDKRIEEGLKQIDTLLAQVEKVTSELTSEREQNRKLMERVSSLELQIATLISPGTTIAPITSAPSA